MSKFCKGEGCPKAKQCWQHKRYELDVTGLHSWLIDEKECINNGFSELVN